MDAHRNGDCKAFRSHHTNTERNAMDRCRPITPSSKSTQMDDGSAIALFVKYPTPGRVKTRMAATIGAERAAEIYRELVERICRVLPSRTNLIVMFDPPERRQETITWLTRFHAKMRLVPQCGADLGVR